MFGITPSSRLRPSPFFDATQAEGVTMFTTYNHMLMPTSYGHDEADYWRLLNGVSMWDVAVERQVQLEGPDAGKLAQILCPRDLSKCRIGQGKYVALCNHHGILLNDPILLKLSETKYWLSIADSNMWFWAQAIAAERGLDVQITEPDVSPLAVQGPLAEDVIASLFGESVRSMKYFWFEETTLAGMPVLLARSGWSKQGGFEIYLQDGSRGTELWNTVREAGQTWDIGPGNPHACERVESGLMSYGGDTDAATNPFEVRMEKYVDLDVPDDVIGIQALRRIKAEGPKRQQLGVVLEAIQPSPAGFTWSPIFRGDERIGDMTNCVWSYRLERNIGFALVASHCTAGDAVTVHRNDQVLPGHLTLLPFL